MKRINSWFKKWWRGLKYDPGDPNYYEPIKVVAIGGGSGLSVFLAGIKNISHKITAVVTVTDNGRSSGRIKQGIKGMLPPGDIRRCLAALSRNNGMLRNIFEYRFPEDCGEFSDHAFGNIWLAALTGYFGSFEKAIEESSNLLQIIGKVYPSTLDRVELVAQFKDGQKITGEDQVVNFKEPITKISLNKSATVYEKTKKALADADLIVIGPGSLYTSIIPNFLVKGVKEVISQNKKALKIFICNVSTERGETEQLSAEDHVNVLLKYIPTVDLVLVNDHLVKKSNDSHQLGAVNNITIKDDEISGVKIIRENVIDPNNPLYHDKDKLAQTIFNCYNRFHKKK